MCEHLFLGSEYLECRACRETWHQEISRRRSDPVANFRSIGSALRRFARVRKFVAPVRKFGQTSHLVVDRDGPTYRWVPNLLVNALLEFWLGVSKLIRSRGRAPSARRCLRAHPGHKNTPTGRKCSKIVTFGSFRVRQPVKENQMHREGSELSHIPARCIAFEC